LGVGACPHTPKPPNPNPQSPIPKLKTKNILLFIKNKNSI